MKKVLLFVWFGDQKPCYVEWTLDNFKKMNPNWEVRYVEYSNQQLKNYKNQGDPVLAATLPNDCLSFWVDNYKYTYMHMHKDEFVIYCDLDCFPIAPFDNFIATDRTDLPKWLMKVTSNEFSMMCQHCFWTYDTGKAVGSKNDNWCLTNNNALFISSCIQIYKNARLNEPMTAYWSILMNKSDYTVYEKRNADFHSMNIQLGDNFCLPEFTPIEHYYSIERNKLNLDFTYQDPHKQHISPCTTIPPNLFFIWIGSKDKIPDEFLKNVDKFKCMNPQFKVQLIIDEYENPKNPDVAECKRLMLEDSSSIPYKYSIRENMFLGSRNNNMILQESCRLYLLNKYGGIYLDMDALPVKPFDDYFLNAQSRTMKWCDNFMFAMKKGFFNTNFWQTKTTMMNELEFSNHEDRIDNNIYFNHYGARAYANDISI